MRKSRKSVSCERLWRRGANDVYVIDLNDGRELLLPAIKQCVLSVEMESGIYQGTHSGGTA